MLLSSGSPLAEVLERSVWLGETFRLPRWSGKPSLTSTHCRCGGVWIYSVSHTLVLSLDCMTLTYTNVSQVSAQQFLFFPKTAEKPWHLTGRTGPIYSVEDASSPGVLDLASMSMPFLMKSLGDTVTTAASLYSSAPPQAGPPLVTSCLNGLPMTRFEEFALLPRAPLRCYSRGSVLPSGHGPHQGP